MVERLKRRVTLDDAMPVRGQWTSPDGIVWTRVPDDETVHGSMTGVTAGGSGLVAVRADAMVGTSVDAITWRRVPDDDAVFGRDWISKVTVGPGRAL